MAAHQVKLDEYAQMFVEDGFNSLLGTVTYDYSMESAAIEDSDDHNFTAVSSWFMRYHRLKEKGRISALPKRVKPVKPPPTRHNPPNPIFFLFFQMVFRWSPHFVTYLLLSSETHTHMYRSKQIDRETNTPVFVTQKD